MGTVPAKASSVMRCLAALIVVILLAVPGDAQAQCSSNASSCVSCHETQGLRPILQGSLPWHVDHGFADFCAACHGGEPRSSVKETAHADRRSPLADPRGVCGACHEGDVAPLVERYAAVVRPPPSGPAGDAPRGDAAEAAPSSPVRGGGVANTVLASMAVALGGLLAWLLVRARPRARRTTLSGWLRAKSWSPYLAGAGLGVVVAYAQLVLGRPMAVSGAVDKLAAFPGSAIFPRSSYYLHQMPPAFTWQVWMLLGLVGGAFASSYLAGEVRRRWLPDSQWVPRFGESRWLRLAIAFAGAVLVQVGSAIAGGCTSGLAISGGMTLAPGAFVFMAGMFLGGIPTAWLWYRRGSR